ncbi:MAG: preprotein translocase subunit YajC [Candidatus Omnitrophota bacterium]
MQPNQPPALVQMVPLLFFMVIFYFLLIRPQQKKQKEHNALINNIKKNDEIITSGGIHGTVINVKEKTFVVRVDDNAKIEIEKQTISSIKKKREIT